ncbi:MAG: precorrin-2 dehydrogenase/sirohydrochlorin ferrochelatase family protein [Lentisphaeria bacterium]
MGYPVNLQVNGKEILLIGGGKVAVRKAKRLLECGAKLKVIAPEVDDYFIGKAQLCFREYKSGDISSCFMVIAASDKGEVNKEVIEEARRKKVLCSSVDRNWKEGDFYGAGWVKNDLVSLAVSSNGMDVNFSKLLSRHFENHLGELKPGIWVRIMESILPLEMLEQLLVTMFGVYECKVEGLSILALVAKSEDLLKLLEQIGQVERLEI